VVGATGEWKRVKSYAGRGRLRLAGLGLALLLGGGCGPVWYLDPKVAEDEARRKNLPLLLYFKAWDSDQHRNMRLYVFADPDVQAELQGTINAEMESEFFPDYRNRYRVKAPQFVVMCAPDGRKAHEMDCRTVPKPADFLGWLREAKRAAAPPAPTTSAGPPPGAAR
jgi:hypothetical protein